MGNKLFHRAQMFMAENIICDDKYVWYKSKFYNYLFQVEIESGKTFAIDLPEEYSEDTQSFRKIAKAGDRIFFVPFNAREICIYDIAGRSFDKISLPDNLLYKGKATEYSTGAVIDEYIIMFGYHPVILIYKMTTGELSVCDGFEKLLPEENRPRYWFESNCVVNGELYLSINGTHRMLKINPDTKAVTEETFGKKNDNEMLDGLFYDGELIWSVPRVDKCDISLYSWNPKTGDFKEYSLKGIDYRGMYSFSKIGTCESKLYLIPARQDKGYIYDVTAGRLQIISDLPTYSNEELSTKYSGLPINYQDSLVTDEGHIIAIHFRKELLVDIDMKKGKVLTTRLDLNKKDYHKIVRNRAKRDKVSYETGIIYREDINEYNNLVGFINVLSE